MTTFHKTAIVLGLLTFVSSASAQGLSAQERYLIDLINASRAQYTLPPLAADPRISQVARSHSYDMASHWFFGHDSPTTGDVHARLRQAKVPYSSASQNIAYSSSPYEAHASLMRSAANRDLVLSREFTHVGVGIVQIGRKMMITENFIASSMGWRRPWTSAPPAARSPWGQVARPRPQPWGGSVPRRPEPRPVPQPQPQPQPQAQPRAPESEQCSIEGSWQGTAPDGMLRGQPITFEFWNNGMARGTSGSVILNTRWERHGNQVTITDVSATPAIAACSPSQVGQYTLTFSEDCRSVRVMEGRDSCSHRRMTLNGLAARRSR